MRKSGLTGDEAYALSKHGKTTEDLGPLKKEIGLIKEDIDNLNDKKITKFYASNLGETHITDSDDGKIQDMMIYGKSSQDGTPSPENPVEIKSVVNPTVKVSNEDGTKSQTVTLPYTLNAIPVASNGNVTIDGQQYVSDYIDVERGKVLRCIKREPLSKNGRLSSSGSPFYTYNLPSAKPKTITEVFALCNLVQFNSITTSNSQIGISSDGSNSLRMRLDGYATLEQYTRLNAEIIYELATPIEEDLTSEQIQSL